MERFNADLAALRDANDADVDQHEKFKEETLQQIGVLKETSQKGTLCCSASTITIATSTTSLTKLNGYWIILILELVLANNKLSAMRAGIEEIITSYKQKAELLKEEHAEVISKLGADIKAESAEISRVQDEIKKVSLSM